jgi:LacI family transcriptional regulator
MATLIDVARTAGVSIATASRVLNPGSHPVSRETAERVRTAAQDLAFRPNALARGLRSRWTRTVGVLVHDVTDPYFAEIARGIADAAWENGFLTITCNTDRDPDEELRYVGMLCESRVAGVVFVGGGLEDDAYRTQMRRLVAEIHTYGGHVVALGPRRERWAAEIPDNRGGARQAVEHLLSLGHRSIALIGGPRPLRTSRERAHGFADALRADGIEPDPRLIVSGDFTREGAARAMEQLLDGAVPFSAVVVTTDNMAIGCLRTLRERGIAVPREMSLVGFDNIPVAEYLNPPLTTVDLHMREVGVAGMRRLQTLLDRAYTGPRLRTHPTDLVVRASTGPAPGVGSDGNFPATAIDLRVDDVSVDGDGMGEAKERSMQ